MSVLSEWLREHRITEVECVIPDFTGIARGKIVPREKFSEEEGMRLPEVVLVQTVTGEYAEGISAATDPDMVLVPDPNSIRLVPWAKDPVAQVIHDCYHFDGSPVEQSPRHILRRVLKLYEDRGWEPVVAPEMEFYIVDVNRDPDLPLQPPIGRTGRPETGRKAYSIDAVNEYDDLFEEIYDFCDAQNLAIDTLIHEVGACQMEINFLHGNPLDLADQVFLFKRTVREAAIRHNMYATFMAKPMENEPGSAMHIHMSVIDKATGKNVFSNADGSVSETFLHSIGGMQKYFPQVIALFAPFVNSYRRLVRHTAAPINVQWGYDNRTCGIRVPHSGPSARRIENRLPGVDCNPYIALAATLACAYQGIVEKIDPTEPLADDAYGLPFAFPRGLDEAIIQLQNCKPIAEVLGENFVKAFCAVKEAEYVEYARVISPWERKFLLLHV
ncbi:glutamine synthetase family protein [Crenobacter cavernae]|uniref:Glutamine synthetase n=1 Tax=Crenobacter cavernae TaxID=2290923 RepID=A0A345Y5N2_9NEIS|nr:glutamine synthetase family protein [Crenobacter cavernae]AXK39234.1 glutamine synthetase [Crenobacter cavernae]RXZ43688.1 glutamine synthetase [Crenobacter cavernae]